MALNHEDIRALIEDRIQTIDAVIAAKEKEHRNFLGGVQKRKATLEALLTRFEGVDITEYLTAFDILREEGILDRASR
jgi:hypothetical protein